MHTSQKRVPDTVYHYCSVNSFFSIISSKSFRLCDIQKSNDSKELIYIFESFHSYLQTLLKKERNKNTINNLQTIKDFLESYDTSFINMFHSICFSQNGDDLYQWRGYADDATGISIGIKTDFLKNFSVNSVIKFQKVSYNVGDLILSNEALKQYFKGELSISNLNMSRVLNHIFDILYDNMCFVKNSYFESEHEYRLSINSFIKNNVEFLIEKSSSDKTTKSELNNLLSMGWKDINMDISEIKFMPKNNKLVSYRDVTFHKPYIFLNKIFLGPKCPLTREDVYLFLISNDIEIDFNNIVMSEGSYR